MIEVISNIGLSIQNTVMNFRIDVAQNFNLGVLTVFIPVGIYIFQQSREYSKIDLNIVLSDIFDGGKYGLNFFLEISLLFWPFLFWYFDNFTRYVIIFAWMAGFYFVIKRLSHAYLWIISGEEYKVKKRKEFLEKSEEKSRNLLDSWDSFWNAIDGEKLDDREELIFFNIFSSKIDEFILRKKLKIVSQLIENFNNNLDKRSIVFVVVYDEILSKILEWHFKIWEKEYYHLKQKDRIDYFGAYSDISEKLNDIIIKILRRALIEGHSYNFFRHLKKHVLSHKDNRVEKHLYLNSLPVYEELFEKIVESNESHSIWEHYFPKEWKITKDNFKKSIISRVWLDKFFPWANNRIGSQSVDYDKTLDEVVRGLFPEINPIRWALILAYFSISWGDSRMKALVEWKRNFGFSSRVFVGWGEDDTEKEFEKSLEITDNKTYELAALIFGRWLEMEIDDHIVELKELEKEYSGDDKKNARRKSILETFKGIKRYM